MKTLLKSISISLIGTLVAGVGYMFLEPAMTYANSQVAISLDVTKSISITVDANTNALSNKISVTNNSVIGTSTFTVITNGSLGYTMSIAASTSPALVSGGNTIDDYATTTATGPSSWSVPAGGAKFGFSLMGTDIKGGTAYWGNDTNCGATSTPSTNLKYNGFYTAATTTASRTSTTTPSGVTTTVCYAVAQGTSYFIPSGTYTVNVTGTAVAN